MQQWRIYSRPMVHIDGTGGACCGTSSPLNMITTVVRSSRGPELRRVSSPLKRTPSRCCWDGVFGTVGFRETVAAVAVEAGPSPSLRSARGGGTMASLVAPYAAGRSGAGMSVVGHGVG
jgi:hypothetical protein